MGLKKGYRDFLDEARKVVTPIPVSDAVALLGDPDHVFIDLRDVRELKRDGRVPGAHHAPRGMLEFWVDPESPYYRDIFNPDKKLVLFCAAGWRSALAAKTLLEMGFEQVVDIDGGFGAWVAAGGPVEFAGDKG